MSSSLTYTFRKRRISPASSRKCCFNSGNCWSSAENSSPKFVAEHFTCPVPDVRRRNAVGICTVTVISSLHGHWKLGSLQRSLQKCFEVGDLGPNRLFHFVLPGEHVRRLQTIAGDTQDGRFIRGDASLAIQFARASSGYTTGSLGEDAFRLRQKLNRLDHFGIGNILRPASGFGDDLDGIMPVGRIPNRERSSKCRRLLWLYIGISALYCS